MKHSHPDLLLGKVHSKLAVLLNTMNGVKHKHKDYEKVAKIFAESETAGPLLTNARFDEYIGKNKSHRRALEYELKWYRDSSEKVMVKNDDEPLYSSALKIRVIGDFADSKKPEIYSVSKNFFDAVKTMNKKIPVDVFPQDWEGVYLKFPDHKIAGEAYNGCYVKLSSTGYVALAITPTTDYTIAGCNAVLLATEKGYVDIKELSGDENEHDLYNGIVTDMYIGEENEEEAEFLELINGIINTLVYINSKDPDIESLRPLREIKSNRREYKLMSRDRVAQAGMTEVKLISWSFHGKTYGKDSTVVSSHMRWQRVGKGLQDIKLVWVKEHERKYNR